MSSKRKYAGTSSASGTEQDDAFVAGVMEVSAWAKRHQQALTAGIIIVGLLLAAGVYYLNYRQNLGIQAANELEGIQSTVALGDREVAKGELTTFMERFGGTPLVDEARILLGQLHLDSGSADLAVSVLEPLGRRGRDPLALQAATLLAAGFEEAGRPDEAIEMYLSVAERSDMTFQRREAVLDAARVMTAQGDFAGAAGLYQDLMDELEDNDPRRGIIELRLAEVRQRAGSATSPE